MMVCVCFRLNVNIQQLFLSGEFRAQSFIQYSLMLTKLAYYHDNVRPFDFDAEYALKDPKDSKKDSYKRECDEWFERQVSPFLFFSEPKEVDRVYLRSVRPDFEFDTSIFAPRAENDCKLDEVVDVENSPEEPAEATMSQAMADEIEKQFDDPWRVYHYPGIKKPNSTNRLAPENRSTLMKKFLDSRRSADQERDVDPDEHLSTRVEWAAKRKTSPSRKNRQSKKRPIEEMEDRRRMSIDLEDDDYNGLDDDSEGNLPSDYDPDAQENDDDDLKNSYEDGSEVDCDDDFNLDGDDDDDDEEDDSDGMVFLHSESDEEDEDGDDCGIDEERVDERELENCDERTVFYVFVWKL